MIYRSLGFAAAAAFVLACGCHQANTPVASNSPATGPDAARAANQEFLTRSTFDPWVLRAGPSSSIPAYLADGHTGYLIGPRGVPAQKISAGSYKGDRIQTQPIEPGIAGAARDGEQTLDLKTGTLTTKSPAGDVTFKSPDFHPRDWVHLWDTSDVVIAGDNEAQQVTHAQLFSLLSSVASGSDHSIPPMGLSSTTYLGHIFWDADSWMFPALIVQHPDDARAIVEYRYKRLNQAVANAREHKFPGAEYPWESAVTGAEVAPAEFARERHITADVAYAAWQYYLWTGDSQFLKSEGFPILKATADYWTGRATRDPDGTYHIRKVVPPDETAGLVDDDSYTNAAARYNLTAAGMAAKLVGAPVNPAWAQVAGKLVIPQDAAHGIPAEHDGPQSDRMMAKQADTLLMLWPLGVKYGDATAGKMLDFYSAHTSKVGPAMTAGIHAVVAARLGRTDDALAFYRDSYRPFMRGGWDAFSEKRTTNAVYFMTGMAASLQSVLYGFGGLEARMAGDAGAGTKIADDNVASLYCNPHLPSGWTGLTIKGVRFRGKTLDVVISQGNKVQTVIH